MDKYTCIIIEDEPLALEKTKDFVSKVPFLQLSATFDNALTGLAYLNNNKVDILFLDINMDELTGIELLQSSKITSQVIITTAYQEYALKGYELQITDYLLKPFSGMRDYLRIHTVNKKLMTLQNFSEFEKLIPSSIVCRVHKSYMVALNKIESIERSRIKIADQLIPISETYKELFFQLINARS